MDTIAIPSIIKAIQIQANKTVKVIEIPFGQNELVINIPEDQIIVRVRAVALNPTEWRQVFGDWGTPGTILGSDCAGDVVRVGATVKHLKVGDRVAGFTYGGFFQRDNGAYAEYVRLQAAVTFKIPDDMTYEEGAALPLTHLTAVQALYMRLNIPKPFSQFSGEKEIILIWGGSTSVGHNAIQLANLSGLRVFVAASTAVHEDLKAIGAEACFDYRDVDAVKHIQAAAGERGIIYGLDTVCENGTTESCVDAMSTTRSGHLIIILPTLSKECLERRENVKVEFCLVHTELGFDLALSNGTKFPAMPDDKTRALEYVELLLPRVLEGWKTGKGSSALKPQRLRRLGSGLEKVEQGLMIMRDGEYGREKLVCAVD